MRNVIILVFSYIGKHEILFAQILWQTELQTLAATIAQSRVNHSGTWEANLLFGSEK